METTGQSIKEMFQNVQSKLKLTVQALDPWVARQEITHAEQTMSKIESLVLANPMVTDKDLGRIVSFTHGSLWNQAREHVAQLNR